MNPSRARIEDSLGKSWNAVLAARIRMPAVNTCSRIHKNPPPKIVEPTWESTEFDCAMCSSTRTWSSCVITVMPRNRVTAIAPMIASVDAALLGLRATERRHTVGDRLHAGERGGARGERPQQQEQR